MITWIQRVFQRHNKWLFSLLLIVIIVAFVLTITPAGGGLRQGEETARRSEFFGVNLASESEVQPLILGAQVSTWLNTGNQVTRFDYLLDLALNRTALLALADQVGIPGPSEAQLEEFIRANPKFSNATGAFDMNTYTSFRENLKLDERFTEAMVHKALVDDYRIEKASNALAGPGYIQAKEAINQVISDETVWSVDVAKLDYASYQPELEIDEEGLVAFYESTKANHEEPPKANATAVNFNTANFRGKAAESMPDDSVLETYFQRNKARFKKVPEINIANTEVDQTAITETTFAEVREEVEQAWIDEKAKTLAEVAAFSFTEKLYENSVAKDSPQMEQLITELGAVKETLEPYSHNRRPPKSVLPLVGLNQIFDLPVGRYFTDAVSGPNGASVLLFEGLIESRIPELEEVRQAVESNYKEDLRKELFYAHGEEMHKRLQEALENGEVFSELAEAEGLELNAFDDFTSKEPPTTFNRALFAQNNNLKPGQLSPMVFIQNKGNFVYLKSKEKPDIPLDSPMVEASAIRIAQSSLPASSYALVSEIVSREREKAEAEAKAENPDSSVAEN